MNAEPTIVRHLTVGKALVALTLIALGSTLVFVSVAGFLLIQTSPTTESSVGGTSVPQVNSTVMVTDFATEGGSVGIAWEASAPIHIYVLNQSQYLTYQQANLLRPLNSESLPAQWIYQHSGANGSVSTSLSRGQFYILASGTLPAMIQSLSVSYRASSPPQPPSSGLQILALLPYALILGSSVVGVLLIALGVLILAKKAL